MKKEIDILFSEFEIDTNVYSEGEIQVFSPINGEIIGQLKEAKDSDYREISLRAMNAFNSWKNVPAPKRGELVRMFGNILRRNKEKLARLVTIECGKTIGESRGEVQEMIDICDFAVGLSRQLYGLTIQSERSDHVMHENWLPLGPVGIISAFNFPVAVWSWNAAIALVCGDSIVWKPSVKTPLSAIACQALFEKAASNLKFVPPFVSQLLIGTNKTGQLLTDDRDISLISATGSVEMGRIVGQRVAARFGRSILELGGNNAVIICESADIDVALPSLLFGAVGTTGQRCTSTRRAFIHVKIYDRFVSKLKNAYAGLNQTIGDPLEETTLIGPLIDGDAYRTMQHALKEAEKIGGKIFQGERKIISGSNSWYVSPAIVEMSRHEGIVYQETFAPILYLYRFENLKEAMGLHNSVPQGLSSAIFTNDLKEAELFKRASDCGIANVNIGTSGAEIGGAFGGEKETGGGRESGSDAWKSYMRRQTSTTYFGTQKPELAQGISFGE